MVDAQTVIYVSANAPINFPQGENMRVEAADILNKLMFQDRPKKTQTNTISSEVKKTWLGAAIAPIESQNIASLYGLHLGEGVIITSVEPSSPASRANLCQNSVILAFNGESITSTAQLIKMIRSSPIGSTATLKVYLPEKGWTEVLVTLNEAPSGKILSNTEDGKNEQPTPLPTSTP